MLQIHPNSAALFHHKIRLVIEYNLNLEAHTLFDGEIELDESYFGGMRKGKRGRGAGGKTAVFGLLKRNGKVYTAIVKDTKTDTLMPIISSKSSLIALFIRTATKVTMLLMFLTLNTLELITLKNLPKTTITSMVLRISGVKPNEYLESTMALIRKIFTYSSKNASLDLIMVHHLISLKC